MSTLTLGSGIANVNVCQLDYWVVEEGAKKVNSGQRKL